jgi:hypothetical protein
MGITSLPYPPKNWWPVLEATAEALFANWLYIALDASRAGSFSVATIKKRYARWPGLARDGAFAGPPFRDVLSGTGHFPSCIKPLRNFAQTSGKLPPAALGSFGSLRHFDDPVQLA